ncbi:MAG: citrate transporter [Ruminococcaceae bacterium]|nr:citrate transporter [Oscillospiraceae bacterium]
MLEIRKISKENVRTFFKENVVLLVAIAAALITSFIIPPDEEYLGYFDLKTLSCLFCVLAVVCALRNIRFFYTLAKAIVRQFRNAKTAILVLVYITFIGSMLIANDMALLTFLPLGYFILHTTGKEKYMAITFILQNIAANLGGMLTPFGNPQNLYLYSKFNIPDAEFISIMFPPFIVAVVLITACCLIFVKSEPLEIHEKAAELPIARTVIYLLLFTFSILIVFKFIPYQLGLIIVPLALLFLDRQALLQVDYGLLFTFVFFFIFAGNMARIEAVRGFFSMLLEKNTLFFSAMSCQIISNVPSAILLSQFTDNYRDLLLGVNIGGVGTLIASLASLITFKEYTKQDPKHTLGYIVKFTAFNFAFLIILMLFCMII